MFPLGGPALFEALDSLLDIFQLVEIGQEESIRRLERFGARLGYAPSHGRFGQSENGRAEPVEHLLDLAPLILACQSGSDYGVLLRAVHDQLEGLR